MPEIKKYKPVGFFDSGVGGLSVWKEFIKILPNESTIYFADNKFAPYGEKSKDQIISRAKFITEFLLKKNCKLIVVACNTATAAAIDYLRANFTVKFVGMEPAVKPAVKKSKTGNIGVLATKGTINGKLFNKTSSEYAKDKNVIVQIGKGLVDIVENNKMDKAESRALINKYINYFLENDVDQIVLGCTHYPFLSNQIQEIIGNRAELLDPAVPVVKQAERLLSEGKLLETISVVKHEFFTSAESKSLKTVLKCFYQDKFTVTTI